MPERVSGPVAGAGLPEAARGWAKWRDEAVLPTGYDDVAALVKLARRARDRIVEFEWAFSGEDLRRLRSAVHHWSTGTVGRFKCFDARIIAAINDALDEHDTVFVVNEPKRMREFDCAVSCRGDAGAFRLCGHGPFDVVFGYGVPSGTPDVRLGPQAAEIIRTAVSVLGWDLDRLAEPRLRPVRNALCGLRVNYGIHDEPIAEGPPREVSVHFHGPYSGLEMEGVRCLFSDPIAERCGVYLWTVAVAGQEVPWYVGQTTRGFGQRTGEHIAAFLSGQYSTWDAEALGQGRQVVTWRAGTSDAPWPHAFLRDYERLAPHILGMLRRLRFHVAPLSDDAHLIGRIEGALGRYLKQHENPLVRDFFGADIHLPLRIPYDTPLRVLLTSETSISGLPSSLLA